METFSRRAFVRLWKKLSEAGLDSELARRFVLDENFAVSQLEQATEEIRQETCNKSAPSETTDDFRQRNHFW